MKFFRKAKDGGPKSTVTGYWLAEIKSLFSIVLLKFEDGSRDEYHNHAFNSMSWLLSGQLEEDRMFPASWKGYLTTYKPSLIPILTGRDNMRKVSSKGRSYVLTFMGPWGNTWDWIGYTCDIPGFGRLSNLHLGYPG